MALDTENEWIKNANRLPWKAWEAPYAAMFTGTNGTVAKPCRMVLGSFIIQLRLGFSDRELVKQLQENPYYQYFIGLEAFQQEAPFTAPLLSIWRKRIDMECWNYSGLFQNSSLVCHQIARYTVKVTMSNRGEKKGSLIPRKFDTQTENKKPTKHDKNSGKRAVCQSTVENAV